MSPIRGLSTAGLTAVLACAAVPACVIPIGPDFQDPLATQNSPPYFVHASPDQGTLVVGPPTFQVWVTDPNPGDGLTVRWYADFPPLQGNTHAIGVNVGYIQPSSDGSVQTTMLEADPDCAQDNLAPGIEQHTITVVVSDVTAPSGTTTPFDGNHEVTATWSLALQCRSSNGP